MRRQEIALEAIEGFDRQADFLAFGMIAGLAVKGDAAAAFGWSRPGAGELPMNRVNGAADDRGPQCSTAVDEPFGMVECRFSRGAIAAQRILVGRRHDGDNRACEADLVQHPAEPRIVLRAAFEDRDLDTVIAGSPDVAEQLLMLWADMTGPQQEIEADLHIR